MLLFGRRLNWQSSTSACQYFVYACDPLMRGALEGEDMRKKCFTLTLALCIAIIASGCERLSRSDVSGVWKGSMEGTDKRGHKWQGPAELTLNQKGDAITGTFVFTPPQAGRVQVPISSGVVSKNSLTFSGQNQFQMASIELTFHGTDLHPEIRTQPNMKSYLE